MARESIEERRARLLPGATWLRAQREQRGLSGSELARRLAAIQGTHVQQERVSAYERAQDEPPADFARALAEVFGLPELTVWRGLGKPLPRELERPRPTYDDPVARDVEERYPGLIAAIIAGDPLPPLPHQDSDVKPNVRGRTGESERSA